MQAVSIVNSFIYLLGQSGPFTDPDAGAFGTGGVTCGTADPSGAPVNSCTLFYRTDTGTLWMWNGAAWVNLLA